jgi:hypothetical protein
VSSPNRSELLTRAERRTRFRWQAALSVWVVLATGTMSPVIQASASSGTCTGRWVVTRTPSLGAGGASTLTAVAATSPTDAWAVGASTAGGLPSQKTLIEHWDGAAWVRVPSPTPTSGDNGFNDVAALSPTSAFAVGYSASATGYHALVEEWDGQAWNVVQVPQVPPTNSFFTSVSAMSATDVWAGGAALAADGYQPLVEHWDGSSWSVVPVPSISGRDEGILDVQARPSGLVWAVGYQTTSSGITSLAEQWNGEAWTSQSIQTPVGQSELSGISALADNDAWAIGYAYDDATYRPLTEHWDGASWTIVDAPTPSSSFAADRKVLALDTTNVRSVGAFLDQSTGTIRTLGQRWDGSTWATANVPPGPTSRSNNELIGLASVPGSMQIWAAGSAGVKTLMETACRPSASSASWPQDVSYAGGARPRPSPRQNPRWTLKRQQSRPATRLAQPIAVDEATAAGIAEDTRTWSAVIEDFNRDGLPDIFLGRHNTAARLYLNTGGAFTEVHPGYFSGYDRHDCGSADFNGDGLPDILCSVGADHGLGTKRNDLELQQADGTFRSSAINADLMDPFGRGRRIAVIDANGDGLPDLFVGNEPIRPDGMPAPNRLFLNTGEGTFRDTPEMGVDRPFGSDCAQAVDYDSDGWQDLLVCGSNGLHLYHNDQGSAFTDEAAASGLSAELPTYAVMADLNDDGAPDVIEVTRTQLTAKLQSDGTFETTYTRPLTSGTFVAVGDANADGAEDLYVVQGPKGHNDPDIMLLNDGDGTSFTEIPVPQTTEGTGDAADGIDYDGNGLEDFLVLNGSNARRIGPVQLIALFPQAASANDANTHVASGTLRPSIGKG